MQVSQFLRRARPLYPKVAGISFLALILVLLSTSSLRAQTGQQDASSPHHDHGNQNRFPFPHPNVHPPSGSVPAPGTQIVFDASSMGQPLALDHNWRLGISPGIDPAKADFDDSNWPVRDAKQALAEVDESAADNDDDHHPSPKDQQGRPHGPHGRPYAWFRIHVKLPEHHGPLVVFVRVPVSRNAQVSFNDTIDMDLYVNGKLVNPEGPNGANQESYQQISRIYPINIPDSQTDVVLAARIPFVPFGLDAYTAFFAHRTFFIGSRQDLLDHLQLWYHAMLFERLPALVDAGLKLLLALFLLVLFWTQRDHVEYLWLGLQMLCVAPLAYVGLIGSLGQIDQLYMAACVFQLLLISAFLYFEFLTAFLSLRKRWYILALRFSAPMLLTLGPLFLLLRNGSRALGIALAISILFCLLWLAAWVVFVGLTLTISAFKRNYEAALLLLPLLLSVIGMIELASTAAASSWVGAPVQSPLSFEIGPVPIHLADVGDFVGIFVIILIIFVRFLRIHRERERASSELAAARSVQELMIPRESPNTPGFDVDTVYNPAAEVGGDFFHIKPTGDGGLLVVLGDVAGHGLQAAMNVSMLMGALRRAPQTNPSKILAALNEVLVGNSSFTTCQVAYFQPDGGVTVATAGHPPPYLNSQEIELPGGLPLGVTPHVAYEETHLYLHPGDRLLMISDGVPEARKSDGELFGFDRVRNLSGQSAFFIADAAKAFGQEDDITVLTIKRLAAAMAA